MNAEKKLKLITSGSSYLDIDGYACCIGYTELLNLQGIPAIAITSAPFNYSISKSILALGGKVYSPSEVDIERCTECIIMDVSNPRFFDPIAQGRVISEVFDHHTGFEVFWQDKLKEKGKVEFIGCAATLIFEEWEKAGKLDEMRPEVVKILVAAILDNTLNFTASVTHDRDHRAMKQLCLIGKIDERWCESYFQECQQAIEGDLVRSIRNDAKTDCEAPHLPKTIGQITLWDAQKLFQKKDQVCDIMNGLSDVWFLNVISIKDNKSYFVCNNAFYRSKLSEVFGVKFEGDIAQTPKAILRKEIIKIAQSHVSSTYMSSSL